MSSVSLVLPYAVEDADREKPFGYAMEVAAALCLAEAKRRKGGILGGPPERISFLSRLCYPLWAVPWEGGSLIVDGLGFSSYTLLHMKPSNVETFTEDLKRNTSVRRSYRGALKEHAQTFKNFVSSNRVPVEAVIGDEGLLPAIFESIKQSLSSREDATAPSVLIPPRIDEKMAVEKAGKLIDQWEQMQSEIKGLQYAINVLDEEMGFHEKKILREIEETGERSENEILLIKPAVEKKVEQLIKERDGEIQKTMQATEKELQALLKKKGRYERELEKLKQNEEGYRQRRDARKRKGDKMGVSRWDRRIEGCRKEIFKVEKSLQSLWRFAEDTRKQGEAKVEELRESYQRMISQERGKISDIEAARDRETAAKREEIRELRSEASSIMSQIEGLIEQKMAGASELEELAVPWGLTATIMICVPFYLVRYETEAKARYDLQPPAMVEDYEGVLKKIEKALRGFSLESRMNLLMRPRSQALKEMLTSVFVERMQKDRALEKVIRGIGRSNNLLEAPDFRENLSKGMEELEEEGWISSEEKGLILNAYAHTRPEASKGL